MSRRTMRVGVGLSTVLLLIVVWFALQAYPLGGPGRLVVVTVHPGDSVSSVAAEMHARGVIASPLAFRIGAEFFGPHSVTPGSYQIAQNSSFAHVRAVLDAGPNVKVVSVVPGLTLHEIVQVLASDRGTAFADHFLAELAHLAAASLYHPNLSPPALTGMADNVDSFEGLVGVGQYLLTPQDTAASLAQRMSRSFASEAAAAGFGPATTVNGLSAYQLLVAASIVEREGYYPQNMPKVARVIFNRLQGHGPLQMDSTVKYPLGMDAGAVTTAMLANPTPYNTYLHTGLTPTPICTVSTTALSAVLHAPPGPWLYFVLFNKNGDEKFATTFQEQQANERLAAKNLR